MICMKDKILIGEEKKLVFMIYFSLYNNTNSHVQQQGSSDINQSQEQTNDSQTLGNFSLQSSYPTVKKT